MWPFLFVAFVIALMVVIWLFLAPDRQDEPSNRFWSGRPKWLRISVRIRKLFPSQSASSLYREHYIVALRALVVDMDAGSSYIAESVKSKSTRQSLNVLKALESAGLAAKDQDTVATAYYPTDAGLDYLERSERPIRVWLRHNWFPFVVAGVTSAIGILNVVVAILSQSP